MTVPPLVAVAAVCTLACVAFTYHRYREHAWGSGRTTRSRSTTTGTGDSRWGQVLAVVMTLLVVTSMFVVPAAAGLASASPDRSTSAGTNVDETAPANHGSAGANGSTAGTVDAAGTDPGTTNRSGGATDASTTTENTGDVSVTATGRGNTGHQPWYFYAREVNTANGNLFRSAEDASVRALGGDIAFVRSYNSHLSHEHGSLGFGWTHNYAMRVEEQSDGSAVFVDDDGARHTFIPTNEGYEAPPGIHARLRANGSGFDLDRLDGHTLHFDTDGSLQWIADRNGNRVHLEYANGRLTTIRDDSGQRLELTYTDEGRISEVTDPLNRSVEYEYETGDLVAVTTPAGQTTTYDYYENHKLRRVDGPSGSVTVYAYRVESDRVRYRGSGPSREAAANGGLSFAYDYDSDTVNVTRTLTGNTSTITLNDAGNPIRFELGEGTNRFVWDDDMNRIEATNSSGTYSFEYDAYGNLLAATDPLGKTVRRGWRTVTTEDTYVSLRTSRTNARGFTTEYRYDEDGNRIEVIAPTGETRTMAYDEAGNPVRETDFAGRVTRYTYDERGFRTSVTDPTGATTNFSYDAVGRPINRTDPRGNTHGVEYNVRNDVVETVDPRGNTVDYTYEDGRLLHVTRRVGVSGTASTITPGQPGGMPTYELERGENSVTYRSDEWTLTERFDSRGQRTSTTVDYGGFERTLDYTYDADGNLVRIESPDGVRRYEYDARDRVVRAEGPNGTWVEYAYNGTGSPTRIRHSNGVRTTYEYDGAGRTTRVTVENTSTTPTNTSNTTILDVSYTYDEAGNRLTATSADGGVTHYSYDENDRLTNVTYPSGRTVTYTYDPIGNRLSKTVNGTDRTEYDYDSEGRLVRAGNTTYEYDDGNLVAREAEGGERTTYEYGPNGRLTRVDPPDGGAVSFTYLPNGRRLSKATPDGTTYYLYSGFTPLAEFDDTGSVERSYLYGPGADHPMSLVANGSAYAYHLAGTNNVRALTDGEGHVANRYRYAPFGETRRTTERVGNPIRFAGRRYDPETELYYNRLRYYDPSTGRFTRQDPAGMSAGVNRYAYADANPLRFTDAFGLDSHTDVWSGGFLDGTVSGPDATAWFWDTSKNRAHLENRAGDGGPGDTGSFQECDVTIEWTKYGLFLKGKLTTASAELGPIGIEGPDCGSDLRGWSVTCVGLSGSGSAGIKLKGGGAVCGSGAAGFAGGFLEGEAGGSWSIGGSLQVVMTGTITETDCSCIKEGITGYEDCPKYGECSDDDDDDDDDDPPGNDHPDDTHDPSVLSFDEPVDRSSVPDYRYDPAIAVLDRGFDEEMRAFLNVANESSYDTVEVDVSEERLDRYDVLVVPTGGLLGLASFGPFERELDRFVDRGGTLVVMPQQRGYQYGPVPGELRGYGWVEDMSCQFRSVGIDEYCPIVASQGDDVADINVDGYFTEYPDDAEVILTRAKNGQPSMLQYGHGNGTVIATTAYTDWASGHHAWSSDGTDVLGDTLAWARGPRNLTTYAPGENATLSVDVDSYVDVRADRMKLWLYRPDATIEHQCVPTGDFGKHCFGRHRAPPLTFNVSAGLSPLATRDVNADLTMPPERTIPSPGYEVLGDARQTGIWEVGYALYNESHGEIQRVRRADQFALSTFEPSPGGYQRFDSDVKLSVASDAEDYAKGSNATFTITARNEGSENRTVTFWWSFPHHHEGDPGDNVTYGASTTRPANADSPLNRTLEIPAGGERTITYEVPVYARFDRLWLQAHRGTNQSGEYLGRTSRAFFTFDPGVGVNVTTDENRYGWGENATVDVALEGEGLESATVRTVVLRPDNTLVDRHEETVPFTDAGNVSVANVSHEVSLSGEPQDGHYVVTTEVLDDEGDRVGYDSTTFEVPYEVRAEPSLPATVRSTNRVEFAVENLDSSTVSNASLEATLVNPSGTTVWNASARVDVPGDGTTQVAFEDVPVGDAQFGTYELRHVLEYGTNRIVRVRRVRNSLVATGRFTEPRYRQRETASANVSVVNDGRFAVDTNVTLAVPDAGYTESRSLALDPGERATRSDAVDLPADISAGTHQATVTVGSTNPVTRTFEFTVPESDLRIDVEGSGIAPGDDVAVTVRNVGGVDTDADCSVELLGPQGRDFSGSDLRGTIRAGESASTTLTVPEQAVTGEYFAVVSCTDGNTGETTDSIETFEVDGLSAEVEATTDAEVYESGENVTVTVNLTNDGDAIENGTLDLRITDPSVREDDSGSDSGSTTVADVDSGTDVGSTVDTDAESTSGVSPNSVGVERGASTDRDPARSDTRRAVATADASLRVEKGIDPAGVDADGRSFPSSQRRSGAVGPDAGTSSRSLETAAGIDNETVWRDRIVTTNESIVVNSTGSLTLVNTTLRFDTGVLDTGIEVRGGGELHVLENSTIDRADYNYYFEARPNSTLELRDSAVRGADNRDRWNDGPKVETSDAVVENVTFEDNAGVSLLLAGVDGVAVSNSTLSNTLQVRNSANVRAAGNEMSLDGYRGLEFRNVSDSTVRDNHIADGSIDLGDGSTNNTVADNRIDNGLRGGNGIVVGQGSNYTVVRGNVIRGVEFRREDTHGIDVTSGHVVVADNVVTDSETHGIYVSGRNATLRNNTVSDSGIHDVYLHRALNATLRGNSLSKGSLHVTSASWVVGHPPHRGNTPAERRYYDHDIDASNTVDGAPLEYVSDATDTTVRNGGGALWLVDATNVTVRGSGAVSAAFSEGLAVRNVTASDGYYYGVFVTYSNRTTIRNTTAENDTYGAVLLGKDTSSSFVNDYRNSTGNVLADNDLSGSSESGVWFRYVADSVVRDTDLRNATGYHALDVEGTNLTVAGNDASDQDTDRSYADERGILRVGGANNTVANNVVRNTTGIGIVLTETYIDGERNNTVSGNVVADASRRAGVQVDSNEATVADNDVSGSGIRVTRFAKNVSVLRNDVTGAGTGILIGDAESVEIRGNNASDNGYGIDADPYSGSVTIVDNEVTGNEWDGILVDADNATVRGNYGSDNWRGIEVSASESVRLLDNVVTGRNATIRFDGATNATLWNNTLGDGGLDIDYYRSDVHEFTHDVATNNTYRGKPVYYLVGASDRTVPADAGAVWLVDSTNVTAHGSHQAVLAFSDDSTVRNVSASNLTTGFRVLRTNHSTAENVTVVDSGGRYDTGVSVEDATGNRIEGLTVRNSTHQGLPVRRSTGNELANVTAMQNSEDGILLGHGTSHNRLVGVNASENDEVGVRLGGDNNTLVDVVAVDNGARFEDYADGITVSGPDSVVRGALVADNNDEGIEVSGDNTTLANVNASGGQEVTLVSDDNTVRNLTLWGTYGSIRVEGDGSTITGSNLSYVYVEGGRNNTFSRNVVRSYVRLYSETERNLLYDNYFGSGVRVGDTGENRWNVTKQPALDTNVIGGEFLGGNFWADYDGRDTDNDGLGDTKLPYNGDRHPLVEPQETAKVLWQTNVSVDMAAGSTDTLTVEVPGSAVAGSGKRKLSSRVSSSDGQIVASQDPPFYVFESNTTLTLEPDEPIYATGETVGVSGVLTNDGSTGRTYDLSVTKNGSGIHAETVTLAPGETHSYTVNTTADGPFRLTASAGDVTVEEAVEVADPQVEATVDAPPRVDRGPFGVDARLENTGRVATNLTVALAPGNDTWDVTLEPGETRLLEANRTIRSDTVFTVDVSGDVDRSLTAGVAFAENATVGTSSDGIYAAGTVEVPYTVQNTDELPTEFTATFTVGDRIRERAVYLPAGNTTAGSVTFDLPAGTHALDIDWPFGNTTRSLTVAEPDQIRLNTTVPTTPTDGTLRTTVDLENVGPNAVNGTLRANSPVVSATRGFDLDPGENDTITLALAVPDGTDPGRYDLTVSAESDGETLAERTSTFETAGPVFELVSEPEFGTYGLGEEVPVNVTVANTGTSGGQVALNATAPGIAETSETAWLGAGERQNVTATVRLPDDLEAGSYDLFYGLDGADRRTGIAVAGAKVDVDASLDRAGYTANETANLTLTVTNERDIDLESFVRVKFNDNETVESLSLNGSEAETLSVRVPIRFDGDDKIFYGVYADTGRSLYISGAYPHRARPDITVSTDQQIYEPGEQATVTVETGREGEVMLSAPGFGWQRTVNGTAQAGFEVPPLGSGTYHLHYSFGNESYSYPFDVDGYGVQVRNASLDQGVYRPGDTVGLGLELVPTRNVSTTVTATVRDTSGSAVDETERTVDLETGRNAVSLAPTLPAGAEGTYLVRYRINGAVGSRTVIDTRGVKYLEVEAAAANATNRAPVPVIGVSPSDPVANESVTFDASASRDPDGSIARYEWDVDGDGVYEATGVRTTHTFVTAGEYTVALRVTDDGGATNRTTETVQVGAPTATPTPTPAPGDGDGGDGGGGGGGGQPGAPGGEVEFTGATLLNDSVVAGTPVLVRVSLANYDPAEGRLALALSANGSVVAERTVAVGASTERTVTLRGAIGAAGTYSLAVNGEAVGTVTVTAATATPTRTAPPTPAVTSTGPTRSPVVTVTSTATATGTATRSSPTPSTPSSGDGPGLGPVAALLALLALVGIARLGGQD